MESESTFAENWSIYWKVGQRCEKLANGGKSRLSSWEIHIFSQPVPRRANLFLGVFNNICEKVVGAVQSGLTSWKVGSCPFDFVESGSISWKLDKFAKS